MQERCGRISVFVAKAEIRTTQRCPSNHEKIADAAEMPISTQLTGVTHRSPVQGTTTELECCAELMAAPAALKTERVVAIRE
jgi:hypothetical protein